MNTINGTPSGRHASPPKSANYKDAYPLRALRLDTDYRDSLDEFTSRFRFSAERRRHMEDATTAPLTKVFRGFEEFSRDYEAARYELLTMADTKDVTKLRPKLAKILTESAFVKNTSLPKRFLKCWDEWKKIDDRRKLLDQILKIRKDQRQLRKRWNELPVKQQEIPDEDHKRMEALQFELDVIEFQLGVLIYEQQSWKNIKDNVRRLKQTRETFFSVVRSIRTLLDHAYVERLEGLVQSWPGLDSSKIKDVDLLTCKLEKAEETVASLLKLPDAQRAGRKQIRRLRTRAESYPIQHRLFQVAFMQREALREGDKGPSSSPTDKAPEIELPGLIGSIGQQPQPRDSPFVPSSLLKTEASFARAKRHLLQTWIDYQKLRLDLYAALGVAPPER